MADTDTVKKIAPRQERALESLLKLGNVRAAAKDCDVPRRTLQRWLQKDKAFIAALRDAQTTAIEEAGRVLAGYGATACARLVVEMGNRQDGTAQSRIRAACAVLENMLAIRSATDLEQRIANLEQKLSGSVSNGTIDRAQRNGYKSTGVNVDSPRLSSDTCN